MSQEAVERLLGRLITDDRFRKIAAVSLDSACLQEGYRLTSVELNLLSGLDIKQVAELAAKLDPGLCRTGYAVIYQGSNE
jgi:hypothetical protein